MSFVAVALGGTALNMGGSIFGGLFGSGAEKRRAATIREAGLQGSRDILKSVTDANLKADEYLNTARGDLSPFRDIGVQAGQTLANMLMGGGNLASLLKSSDLFNFQSEIGSRNINRELAARGLYGSGAGLETLARFNNQLVAEEGQRFTDRLLNLTQLGANTANSMAGFTSNTGNSIAGRIYTGGVEAANMRYNSAVGAAQAQSNATQMLGQMGQNIFGAASQGLGQFGNFALNKPMIDSSIAANNALAARYAPQSMGMTNDDY
jgi:hypothetical protein